MNHDSTSRRKNSDLEWGCCLIAGFSKHYPLSFLGTCFLIGAVAFSYITTFRNHSSSQGCLSPPPCLGSIKNVSQHWDKPCFWSYKNVDERVCISFLPPEFVVTVFKVFAICTSLQNLKFLNGHGLTSFLNECCKACYKYCRNCQ